MALGSPDRRTVLIAVSILGVTVLLVGLSLRRPEPPTYAPTPAAPVAVGERLDGPVLYTIDASDAERWRYFAFASRSVVDDPDPLGWDLAFRRFHVIANGGPGFVGVGGIAELGSVSFDDVVEAPSDGYQPNRVRSDTTNPGIGKWYRYGFTSHLLTPEPRVYAVRTADGRFAKLELLSYYCTGARPGCITLRYVYQGNGSRRLAP